MAKDKNMRITTPEGDCSGSGLKRFLVTLIIIVIILYVGAFFGLRTAGARSLIDSSLEKRLGMEVEIGEAKLAFPLGVTMQTVKAGEPGENLPGFLAQEICVKFLTFTGTRVSARGVELVLAKQDDGSWAPRFFSRMGDLPARKMEVVSEVTKSFRDKVSVDIDGALIKWIDERGSVDVLMEGVDFEMQPVKLPGREMFHYKLAVFKYRADVVGGGSGHDVVREWLSGADAGYVEVLSAGEMPASEVLVGVGAMEIRDEDH
jgi:hypothetical protein